MVWSLALPTAVAVGGGSVGCRGDGRSSIAERESQLLGCHNVGFEVVDRGEDPVLSRDATVGYRGEEATVGVGSATAKVAKLVQQQKA
ncbi:hypothetical protein B296_00013880 [Ensete ventricosum]|uniref:SMP domain-containing protein n=1 Tax=Ensete ventricosum TaxID=4639 RepID=A0A426Y789_ENSVE|nr:hypothetical protein B296_00013880 [Ensete ventricosum]